MPIAPERTSSERIKYWLPRQLMERFGVSTICSLSSLWLMLTIRSIVRVLEVWCGIRVNTLGGNRVSKCQAGSVQHEPRRHFVSLFVRVQIAAQYRMTDASQVKA